MDMETMSKVAKGVAIGVVVATGKCWFRWWYC